MKIVLRIIPMLAILAFAAANTGCGTAASMASEDEGKVVIRRNETANPRFLDPHTAGDVVSSRHTGMTYETLFEYHYLTKGPTLVPLLAAKEAEYDEKTLTYTFTLRKDIRFTADRCWHEDAKGKSYRDDDEGEAKQELKANGRLLTSKDFIYSFKRLAALKKGGFWVIEGQIEGLDEFRGEALKLSGEGPADDPDKLWREHLNNTKVNGIKYLDDQRFSVTLVKPYPQFLYAITLSYGAAVAREAVEYYGRDFFRKPVGTGPFVLTSWKSNWELVWERNPDYREINFPSFDEKIVTDSWKGSEKEFAQIKKKWGKLAGKKLPISDKVDFRIIKESQPAFLNFKKGMLDISGIDTNQFDAVIAQGLLKDDMKEKGIWLLKYARPSVSYFSFNMTDSEVGAPAGDKGRAIRKALARSIDRKDYVRRYLNERGQPAAQLVPPGVNGRQPENDMPSQHFDPEAGRKILTDAGFKLTGSGDNFTAIDPETNRQVAISVSFRGNTAIIDRYASFVVDCGRRVGIKVEAEKMTFNEFLRRQNAGEGQCYNAGWVMDYPDAQNMLQLLYGPNKPPGINSAGFDNAEYNRLYSEMAPLDDSVPEQKKRKNRLIRQMHEILEQETPWVLINYGMVYSLNHEWHLPAPVPNAFNYVGIKYHYSDSEARSKKANEWEETSWLPLILFTLMALAPAGMMIRKMTKEK
ncbi:MAG: ABC transporter substrate-binding protein [Planctomycetes bacterium]|nr:ABC transporter substrate-binding protein [Planctomycetota bacterium]